jgi:hypothetical protein
VEIPIGVVGRTRSGDAAGLFVRVDDDSNGATGGYYILLCREPEFASAEGAADYWVERRADLERFFAEAGWSVEWLGSEAPSD